jgi:hypothetical protein
VLCIVDEQVRSPASGSGGERGGIGALRAELLADRGKGERVVAKRRERDEERRALRILGEQASGLDGEARLTRPARPHDREHPRIALEHERDRVEQFTLPPHEARRRCRQLDATGSPQRSERARPELLEAE